MFSRSYGAAAAAWLLVVAGLSAQGPRPVLAEDVFKNVQVLKGIPVDEFMGTMGFFSASLGLNCTDCHVEESGGDWARYADDNNLKRTTRRMMLMVNGINDANFGGRQVVTCNTCHRGSSRPNVMPSLDLLYGEPPPEEPGDPIRQLAGQPSAESILDRHIDAVGGARLVNALTTVQAKGTYMAFDDAGRSPAELHATAQGQRTIVARLSQGNMTWTVNASGGSLAAPLSERPLPSIPITGQELEGLRVEADVFFPTRLKQALRNWRVGAPTLLEGDREVRVVQGDTPSGGVVTLCFDAETGLLTRLVRYAQSPVGRLVTRVDYAEYREVNGVKIPSKWTVRWLSGRSTFEFTEMEAN
jgi:hypothetical protein